MNMQAPAGRQVMEARNFNNRFCHFNVQTSSKNFLIGYLIPCCGFGVQCTSIVFTFRPAGALKGGTSEFLYTYRPVGDLTYGASDVLYS